MAILGQELLDVLEEGKRRFTPLINGRGPSLRDWLTQGGTYFVTESAKDAYRLEALDGSWGEANGADYARYMWAATESILPRSVGGCDGRSIGWASVSAYYTAFYMVLGLMRAFGHGMMYLTADDTAAISGATGAGDRLEKGTYAISIEPGPRAIVRLKKKPVKGFHDGFWKYVDDTLDLVGTEVAAGRGVGLPFSVAHRNRALVSLGELRSWLGKPGAAGRDIGWMSELRNDINYRLARNVWAPNYRERGVEGDRLRQDVLKIIRGDVDRLGVQLRLDRDIRAMVERVCVLFRELSKVKDFPRLSA